jgi:hypothetical protein
LTSQKTEYTIPLTALSGSQKQTTRMKLRTSFSIFFVVFEKKDAVLSKNVLVSEAMSCNALNINTIGGG